MLTDQQIRALQSQHPVENDPMPFARAIIAATLAKLAAGVSVEPDIDHFHHPDDMRPDFVRCVGYTEQAFNTAIAAARVAMSNKN